MITRFKITPPERWRYQSLICVLCSLFVLGSQTSIAQEGMYNIQPFTLKYNFNNQQTPDQLLAVNSAANTGASFQWQSTSTAGGVFTNIGNATTASYTPPLLAGTTWFQRITTNSSGVFYSNVVKYELVSLNWEDLNYTREHNVLTPGNTTWQQVDALLIGDKLVSTTYYDELGRPVQRNEKGVATPATGSTIWGDIVQQRQYDNLGRTPKSFLPYTTTATTGKFKADASVAQQTYYTTNYADSKPYSIATFEASPIGRVKEEKAPGDAWNNVNGNKGAFKTNTLGDGVRQFTIGVAFTDKPVLSTTLPIFSADVLAKVESTDARVESTDILDKKTLTYYDGLGQLILKKVQLADNATSNIQATAHTGWICTYYVYDHLGQLRCEIQPEGVNWLAANGWTFAGTPGQQVFDEQCFVYEYDEKGRVISKKSPGVKPLYMLYDSRDRVVFMQDGNQRLKSPAEWTANIYDELDRVIITTLYRSAQTRTQLQAAINAATISSTVTVTNPGNAIEDLEINFHTIGTSQYAASRSVTISEGFESNVGANFEIKIEATATAPAITVITITHKSPVSAADLGNPAITTILKYLFYDNYSHSSAKPFDAPAASAAAAYPPAPNVLPIATTTRNTSMPTGSLTRVLGSTTFLASTVYYDEDGNAIQSIDQNIKLGYDVSTSQYGWDGRLLASYSRHAMPGGDLNGYGIRSKYLFDKIGRVTSIDKTFGSNTARTIAAYQFDDMGRLKTKILDPNYVHPVAGMGPSGGGLETIDYSYNIQGSLVGQNKDYALKAGGYNKWQHFFGTYIGYDKNGGVLNKTRLNGQMAGQVWNTMGDDAQRKFEYVYDNAGRLSNANFSERATTAAVWINSKMDFSSSGATYARIDYDLNGNIKEMTQRGVLMGNQNAQTIDDLRYTYNSYSNKLLKVVDQTTIAGQNGVNGDFKDGSSGAGNDYVYDDNGNMVADLNKEIKNLSGANGIVYNHLDKPEQIKIVGKGTINITYDADGSKLRRTFTAETGGAKKTTTYINEYVYEETNTTQIAAQFISFEEGRIRPVTLRNEDNGYDAISLAGNITLPIGKQGSIDYYLTDQRHDTRMIITEETQWSRSTASMETLNGRGPIEEGLFGQIGVNNEVLKSRVPKADAPGWASNTTQYISKLNSTNKVGPNQLLKVMAGDQLSTTVQYYYQTPVTNSSGSTVFNDVLSMLAGAITGSGATSAATKNATTSLTGNLNTGTPFSQIIAPDIVSPTGDKPKAYLNIVFFDERFNFVQEASTSQRVSQSGNAAPSLGLLNIKAPKNGYCFVYISNESSVNVFFDNMQVRHDRGRIIEENHYYAFGLKIAAISSKAYGAPNNTYLYQGDFSDFDDDLGWNDFELRSYDPQIGRFLQNDPYDQFASGYVGMGNDPVNSIDPSGGFIGPGCAATAGMVGYGAIASSTISISSTTMAIAGMALNAISLTSSAISLGQNMVGHQQNERQAGGQKGDGRGTVGVAKPLDDWMVTKNGDLFLIKRTYDKEHRFFNEKKELMHGTQKEGEEKARYSWNVWGQDKDYQNIAKAISYSKNDVEFADMDARAKAVGFPETMANTERTEVNYLHDLGKKIRKEDIAMLFAPTPMSKFQFGKYGTVIKLLTKVEAGQGGGYGGRALRVFNDIHDQESPKQDPNKKSKGLKGSWWKLNHISTDPGKWGMR